MSHLGRGLASRRLMALAVVVLALPLAGCPFEAPFPLGEPMAGSLDPSLAGRWERNDPKSGEAVQFEFFAFNATEYVGLSLEKGKGPELARLYTTKIGSASYLNISELKPGKPRVFMFARYAVKGDELSLWLVDEKAVPKEAQTDAKRFVEFLAAHPAVPAADGEPFRLKRPR